MSAINYVKKFFWLVGVAASGCQVTLIENSLSAFSPLSSSNPAVTSSFTKTQSTGSIPHAIFNNILPVLKTQTSLPIRLPAFIPEASGASPVYALLETATRSQYQILLAFSKNCTGGNACRLGSFFAQAITPKTPAIEKAQSPTAQPTNLEQNFSPKSKSMTISTAGIGRAKLGMTFGQLKRMLEPDAEFLVESPFMVDFDAISVHQSGKVQYYILYPAGTTLADTDKIQVLLTDNPNFRTVEGVGPGMPLKQAEAVYGDATLFYHTANESREYIKFANQPQRNIRFRPVVNGQSFAGTYSSVEREYNETRIYHSTAKIRLVEVVDLPQI